MIKYSKLSNYKLKKILRCFSADLTATQTSKLLEINRNTINRYYKLFRLACFKISEQERKGILDGEIELDESYFGPHRVRGKKGRGAKGKTIVFGLLKRNSRVYTQIVDNCSKKELLPIIQGKVLEDTDIYTDGWKSYDGLVTLGYKHHRIYHSKNQFARGKNHVNGIESFWSYTKTRLSKFRGFNKNFPLHLIESEFRFNHKDDLEIILKRYLKIS